MIATAPPLTLGAWLRYDIVRRLLARDGLPGSVLEIGAGRGSMGYRLAQESAYTGVEPDDASRAVAIEVLPPAAAMVADLRDVPPGTFDLVCAFEVLEHIEDDAGALRDWTERVAPGGRLLLSTPAHAKRYGPSDEIVGHVRRYDAPQLEGLVRAAGLDVVEVRHWGFPLGYALDAARNRVAARRLKTTWSDSTTEERTAASGRYLQPPVWAGPAMQVATAPFRWMQRPAEQTSLGTGLLLLARRTPESRVKPALTLNAWLRFDIIRRKIAGWGPPSSVLEIGVGRGAVGVRLAALAPYVGVEIDETSRAEARTLLPSSAVLLADLDDVEGERRFGLVCAFEVLEHIDDDAGTLKRWASFIEPGGHLLVSSPAQSHRLGPFDALAGHLRRYDPDDMAALARDAGLVDVDVRMYGLPLGYALETVRNRSAAKATSAAWQEQSETERTAGSGRAMQPPDTLAAATQVATLPFRIVQRGFEHSRFGTGLVLCARQPA